jgi:5-methylcytosine-specific restriction endonuclease McrA
MSAWKYCLVCKAHHPIGEVCRAQERRRYAASRQRRIRSTARWQRTRALVRQRDGNRCVHCGSSQGLQAHHIVSLEDGGAAFILNNLETVCSTCHARRHRGEESTRPETPSHQRPVFRETNRPELLEPLVG